MISKDEMPKWNHRSSKTCCKWFPQMKFKMSSINEVRKIEEFCFLWYDPHPSALLPSNDLYSIMFRASQKNWILSMLSKNINGSKLRINTVLYVVIFRFLCDRIYISWEVCLCLKLPQPPYCLFDLVQREPKESNIL